MYDRKSYTKLMRSTNLMQLL